MLRRLGTLLLTALAVLAFAPPAGANFVAEASDPAGDATDPSPGRDITAFAVAYDRDGILSASIRLQGSPADTRGFITIAAGTRTATGCNGFPAATFGSYTDEFGAGWLRLDVPGAPAVARGEADKRGFDDAVQTFEAEAAELGGGRYDCAVAILSEPGNSANVYDTAGPVALVGRPALSVRVRAPDRFRVGKSKRMTVRVTNTGDGPARGVRLLLSRERGLKARPRRRSLRTLAPGRTRTVRVALRLSGRARDTTELGIQVRAQRLVAKGTVRLQLRRPSRRGGGGGGGGNFTPRSCVRYSPDISGQTGGSLILVPC